jgi:hypothetical protein
VIDEDGEIRSALDDAVIKKQRSSRETTIASLSHGGGEGGSLSSHSRTFDWYNVTTL